MHPHGRRCNDPTCCTGFNRDEYLDQVPQRDPLFDTLPIHPIFARPYFTNVRCIFSDFYLAYEPAFRLATLLIEASLPFFHTLMYGEFIVLRRARESSHWRQILCINEVKELTEQQAQRTRRALQKLAGSIRFNVNEARDASVCTYEKNPLTDKWVASILIDPVLDEEIDFIFTNPTDIAYWSATHVDAATTLMHELAHAVRMLRHGRGCDVFFEGNYTSEEGFELEKRLFGGVVDEDTGYYILPDGTRSRLKNMKILLDWPDAGLIGNYKETNLAMSTIGEVPKVSVKWNTRMSHFINLLQTSWWVTEYGRRGSEALRFEKIQGQRIFFNNVFSVGGITEVFDPRKASEAANRESIPKGYRVDSKGLIVPHENEEREEEAGTEAAKTPLTFPTMYEVSEAVAGRPLPMREIYGLFADRVVGRAREFLQMVDSQSYTDTSTSLVYLFV
ncbi:hypothetical protein B0A50_05885 [Salinomyces thailandicus]|uniref:Uncharacterized protein n=1 Tax=Salinomyces thailandicus TaxID=706561 RepID=A0A4U0TST6_9PEZI|nr:hypothetical protein B0A50_05885 [Salinomyces thailandica]